MIRFFKIADPEFADAAIRRNQCGRDRARALWGNETQSAAIRLTLNSFKEACMAASAALSSPIDVREFIEEYFGAWRGTDEDRIMSYYAEQVSLRIPGLEMTGKAQVREQFVHPFITAFPGNRHIAKNMIFGANVVVVEWSFEAEHTGPFAGRAASGASVKVPGCSVYEFDPVSRHITAGRIYFDLGTLLTQIGAA
jgi:steroid delta-isomerase-like uncharacterized protein